MTAGIESGSALIITLTAFISIFWGLDKIVRDG